MTHASFPSRVVAPLPLLAMGILGALPGLAQAQSSVQTVAIKDQAAPGTATGVRFNTFVNRPVVSEKGHVAFAGYLIGTGISSANDMGIWAGMPGSLALALREGTVPPGVSGGATFSGFGDPLVNTSGRVAVMGFLRNATTSNNSGIWSGPPGNMTLVARKGSQAPGVASGGVFSGMSSLVFNGRHELAFFGVLTGSGITSSNNTGIWAGAPGSLRLVARRGNAAHGAGSGALYGAIYAPVLNDVGRIAYRATLTGSGVTSSNNIAIWSGTLTSPALVARKGNQVPGMPSGVRWDLVGDPVINNSNHLAFVSTLSGTGITSANNQGIWRGAPSSLALVARKGTAAPGTSSGVVFSTLYNPALNGNGQVAFQAYISGSGVTSANNFGVWAGSPGSVRLVARKGNQAPGTPSGVRFNSFLNFPTLNSSGQVVVWATLTGSGVTTSNDRGIWVTNSNGVLRLVARKGSNLVLSSGGTRTINLPSLVPFSSGLQDGRMSCLNSRLLFHSTFTNGTQGIFLSNSVATLGMEETLIACDFDRDGDVDGDDLEFLAACQTGPAVPQNDPACADADLDGDGDVDQDDFAICQRCYSGPGVPADPSCHE